MNCPHCGKEINVGALIGSVSTAAKARSSRANGKLGGRPKKPAEIKMAEIAESISPMEPGHPDNPTGIYRDETYVGDIDRDDDFLSNNH